jgi:carboxymethylenebutenolidase
MRLPRLFPALLALSVCAGPMFSGTPAEAQDWAKVALDKSPRHREYVRVEHGGRKVTTFVVYPEVKGKAPVIVLIHEIFGESDWFKLQADELAAKGYIVLAPDLLSGMGPNGGGTDALFATTGSTDPVTKAVMTLDAGQVTADLDAVADYGKKLPAANGKLFVAGFCWGGGKTFDFATHRKDLSASFSFYGPPPPTAAMAGITAPVYGFYGENDARIDAMIPQAVKDMKAAGKFYEPVTYAGAGHGFMRAGQAPDASPENKKAWEDGFARMLKILAADSAGKKMSGVSSAKRPVVAAKASAVQCHDVAGME